MKRWLYTLSCLAAMSGAPALSQEWKLDRSPSPIWAQPGEAVAIPLTGPSGQNAMLTIEGTKPTAPQSARLWALGDGHYLASIQTNGPGTYAISLRQGAKAQPLAALSVWQGAKTFTASETTVTRQGPDSDFDRLTPLVKGAQVVVDGRRGDWYRSKASGAWLDGKSGKVTNDPIAPPRLSRIMVDSLPNGDARLTLSCGTLPEAEAVPHANGPLTLTLAGAEHMVFDITKPSNSANFLGPITVRPQTSPPAAVVEIAQGGQPIGGYQLEPGDNPGDLVLRVRKPIPLSLDGLNVTLDAGHGGPLDPGTVGHGGLAEKTLNLRVTESLARMLRERGANVIMTRTEDADVAKDEEGASNELQARIDLSVAADANLYISLHHNARPSVEEGKVSHGTDVYWYQPVSEPLARALADPIADAVGEPLRTSRFRSFHVIRQTFSPAVLIEFQYLSNPELEANVLDRPDYPDKATAGVVKGLEAYFKALPQP